MTRTLQHLARELDHVSEAQDGMCFDVRGPFRASMTFAAREGTSRRDSVEAAAGGLEVQVPAPCSVEKLDSDKQR